MGFYGNIGETNNIHFQFDKIFNSRTDMDLACANGTDNIYQGRFVLVKYDNSDSIFPGEVLYGFMKDNEPSFMYADQLLTIPYIYTNYQNVLINNSNQDTVKENFNMYYEKSNINNQDFYIRLTHPDQVIEGKTLYKKESPSPAAVGISTIIYRKNLSTKIFDGRFYICIGKDSNSNKATWKLINDYEVYGNYLANYQKDLISYGTFFDYRGYDGTVWEKIYSEGSGKYIQIARLNGSAPPAINIIEDKPTLLPKSAYIDTKSSPDLYSVHVPSNWGFRFKQSTEEDPPSEFNITQEVYDEDTQTIKSELFNADVYFNIKQKNHKIQKAYDNECPNLIKIRPSGQSGKKYDGQTEIDTYELSVHLPIVGNMISDGYDLIYGENEPLRDENNELILDNHNKEIIFRPRDISWYEGNDSRKENGDLSFNGKTYNLSTLAGTLNTFHNRLGQNIVMKTSFPSIAEIQTLDEKYIYGIQTEDEILYYRKDIDYNYEPITEYIEIDKHIYKPNKYYGYNELTGTYILATAENVSTYGNAPLYEKAITYSIANISQLEYYPNNYYVKTISDEKYEIATEPYAYYQTNEALNKYEKVNNKVCFYKKNITASKYHEVALLPYYKDTYYYYDNTTKDYLLDHQAYIPTYPNASYFSIDIQKNGNELDVAGDILSKQSFPYSYGPGQYYNKIKNENNSYSYQLIRDEAPDINIQYYRITMTNVAGSSEVSLKVLYQPNKYYYYDNEGNLTLATEEEFDSSKAPYYQIPILEDEVIHTYDPDLDNIIIGYQLDKNTHNWKRYSSEELFNLSDLEINDISELYVKQNGNYINASSDLDLSKKYEYCILSEEENITNELFIPNKYYTFNNDGFHFARIYGNSETIYYQLKPLNPLEIPFYKADTYWYNGGNLFEIDYNIEMTESRTYYTESPLYVLYDSSNRFLKGCEWKNQALYVPASVTLATRKKSYNLFPLKGINNGESSINGIIQASGHILSNTDTDTREKNTIQGALNLFEDNFNLISMMYPDRVLYINDFGQITASSITLSKLKNIINKVDNL